MPSEIIEESIQVRKGVEDMFWKHQKTSDQWIRIKSSSLSTHSNGWKRVPHNSPPRLLTYFLHAGPQSKRVGCLHRFLNNMSSAHTEKCALRGPAMRKKYQHVRGFFQNFDQFRENFEIFAANFGEKGANIGVGWKFSPKIRYLEGYFVVTYWRFVHFAGCGFRYTHTVC